MKLWRMPNSLTARLLLAAGLWTVAALTIGGIVLAAVFRDHVQRTFDERLQQSLDAMVGVSELDASGDLYFLRPLSDQRFAEPYSGWYWQVSAPGEEPLRSRSLWDQTLNPRLDERLGEPRFREGVGPDGQRLRILERDIVLPGNDLRYRYMAAGDLSEIADEVSEFNRILAWALGALGLGLLLAVALQVRFGLAPLRRVRRGLAAVRAGHARRLSADVPDEVRPLVDEVNAVLDHNDTLVERARRHVGNLAHALKTPLTVLSNDIRRLEGAPKSLEKQLQVMQSHIDHHLVRARVVARPRAGRVPVPVARAVDDIVRVIRTAHDLAPDMFETRIEEGLAFLGDRQDLDEILGNLIDNAAKWAASGIRVTGRRQNTRGTEDQLCLVIEDDGPGVDRNQRETILERGFRLDENKAGSGLGLSIVRDIAESCGGSVTLKGSDMGGLAVEVWLPAAGDGKAEKS